MSAPAQTPRLPTGVRLIDLVAHEDERGTFTELFRASWETGVEPVQWNVVHSCAGVLRGVHVHVTHDDYLTVVRGRATIGLADLRDDGPTAGLGCCVLLDATAPAAIAIPHGVAHGFLFEEPSTHVYAVTHYWDPADELGCRWDDPELRIPWPAGLRPRLSPRDAALPPLAALRRELRPAR